MFAFRGDTARPSRAVGNRICRVESLEQRLALSAGPPTVTNVVVSSTHWSSAFISHLNPNGSGLEGYSVPAGSTGQTTALPWNNVDRIRIQFSEDVNVQAADLALSGKNVASYSVSDFFYDPQTHFATWTLTTPIARDRLMIDLDANGIDPVRDLDGTVLDGEWSNNVDTFSSGNGQAGGDFEFLLNVLPGDANSSGQVTNMDYVVTRAQDGKSTTSTGYNAKYDIDGSGVIDSADWQYVLSRVNTALPTGNPYGVGNDAPTNSGFARQSISNAAIDYAISLWGAYGDVESGASGLTYSVASNSAPTLFDSVAINQGTGHLILNAASGVSGRAYVAVVGTDAAGLSTESIVTIDVNRNNLSPQILDCQHAWASENTWIISGTVTDADDDMTGLLVEFHGIRTTRAAIYPDGTFELAIILEDGETGDLSAITYDPHGSHSNMPWLSIGLT